MNEQKLIEKGYFPKEIPPAFHTDVLANNLDEIRNRWNTFVDINTTQLVGESRSVWNSRKSLFFSKYSSSEGCVYSISKGKLARRILKLPNPKHFIKVTELICSKWLDIQSIFSISNYSTSYPVDEENPNKRAVRTFSKNVQDLRNTMIEISVDKLVQVKLDISKFYPTIYTHAISWSMLGKAVAKEYYKKTNEELNSLIASGDINAILYKFSDELDVAVRACQDKQSVGIPIGPDTSHIISEILTCRIDYDFRNQFSNLDVQGCRYYDDYYFFVNSKDEADVVIKGLQKILNLYQLEINDKKVEVKEFPLAFENDWVTDLHRFEFKNTNLTNSLKHYFSLLWGIGEKNYSRTDWIFKYALRTFEFGSTVITEESWRIFENLILKTALIQPAVLDIVAKILLKYEEFIDDKSLLKIKTLIESVIKVHAPINHNFETSWALWIAKRFKIEIEKTVATEVIATNDPISILILLCLDKVDGLVKDNPDYTSIEQQLDNNVLFSELWILAYESVRKGWLVPIDPNLIENNGFFKILNDLDVDFFDCSLQMTVSEIPEIVNQVENSTLGNIVATGNESVDNENIELLIDISNFI